MERQLRTPRLATVRLIAEALALDDNERALLFSASTTGRTTRLSPPSYPDPIIAVAPPPQHGPPEWSLRPEAEGSQLRDAFAWSLQHDADSSLAMVGSLWRWWHLRGRYAEGRSWAESALRSGPHASLRLRAPALAVAGLMATLECDYATAQQHIQEGLDGFSAIKHKTGVSWTLSLMGCVARDRGEYTVAAQLHEQSLVLAKRGHDQHAVQVQQGLLTQVAWLRGDFDRAAVLGQHAVEGLSRLEDDQGTAWALMNLGATARYRGDLTAARAFLDRALELSERIDYREGLAWSWNQLGTLSRLLDDHAVARTLQLRSLAEHSQLGNRWRMASVHDELAALAAAAGDATETASHLCVADQLRQQIGTPIPLAELSARELTVSAAQHPLGPTYDAFALSGGLRSDRNPGAGAHRPRTPRQRTA